MNKFILGLRLTALAEWEGQLLAEAVVGIRLDEALTRLQLQHPVEAKLVHLRFFAGLTIKDAAEVLGISPRNADFVWAYARAWLLRQLEGDTAPNEKT